LPVIRWRRCRRSADYAAAFNPDSGLYFDFFSVFVSGFVVTFALMLQPHILTKVLYLRSERDIAQVHRHHGGGRHPVHPDADDRLLRAPRRPGDRCAGHGGARVPAPRVRCSRVLGEYVLVFIFITLLAAGMSTLDGILVALSAMVVNDIVEPLFGERHNGLRCRAGCWWGSASLAWPWPGIRRR
jgi:sodium/pantothenate symporter